jgi:hypothetical protein
MKKQTIINTLLLALLTTLSGCAVIGGIFKAGMGVGIFVSVLIVALIIFLISRVFKSKK